MEEEDVFKKLRKINVNQFVKQKNKMSYLSWGVAWRLVIEVFPDSTYKLKTFDEGTPCKMTPYGAFVSTEVTINKVTREMTLPVLDGANKSLKAEEYIYKVKEYKWNGSRNVPTGNMTDKKVDAINAFDINKAQMRCLVKNLGVFGLGLDLYIGYDLPADLGLDVKDTQTDTITSVDIAKLADKKGIKIEVVCDSYGVEQLKDLNEEQIIKAYKKLQKNKDK